jgi:hypothetical protein
MSTYLRRENEEREEGACDVRIVNGINVLPSHKNNNKSDVTKEMRVWRDNV